MVQKGWHKLCNLGLMQGKRKGFRLRRIVISPLDLTKNEKNYLLH